jgi:predicted metal-dependent peptidase
MKKKEELFKIDDKINYLRDIMKDIEYADEQEKLKEVKDLTMEIVSNIIYSMRSSKEFNFFAVFLDSIDLELNFVISAPAYCYFNRNHFVIGFNPFLLFLFDKYMIRAIIEHECYHIINKHTLRAKKYKNNNKVTKEDLNEAMDIAVNQYISLLSNNKSFCNLLSMSERYNIPIDSIQQDREFEYYLDLILKNKKETQSDGEGKLEDIEFELDKNGRQRICKEFSKEISYEEIKKMLSQKSLEELEEKISNDMLVQSAEKCRGTVPNSVERLLEKINSKSIIRWQNVLKQYLGQIPIPYKYVRNRPNRKQPRRLDLYGTMPDGYCNIYAAFDSSGSISDEEYILCMNEVFYICKAQKKKFNLTVINCDSKINSIRKIKNKRDYYKITRKGYGGTSFSPVINYLNDLKLSNDTILIYFTDGYGEHKLENKPKGYKIIWVVIDEDRLSLEEPYGRILKLDKDYLNKKYKN